MTKVNGLLVMNVGSTLIQEEGIDLLGEGAGVGEKIADVTARAMNGEFDFKQALDERVGLLKGLPESISDEVFVRMHSTDGARKLVAELHRRGYRVAVVSGGFHEAVDVLAKRIELDYVKANRLGVKDGVLTDKVLDGVITKDVEKASLIEWVAENSLELSRTTAMGDGANDLPMIKTAGVDIVFCVRPVVRKEVPYQANETDSYKVIDILDGKN